MKYVGALDIGSSSVRCHIYNEEGLIVGSAKDTVRLFQLYRKHDIDFQMTLLYPQPRWVEMDPEEVWLKVKSVVSDAIKGQFPTKSEPY